MRVWGNQIRTSSTTDACPDDAPPLDGGSRPFHVVFDVSDLINYFRSARLPTGIQRVQIEIVDYAIREGSFDFSIACFTKEANYWIEIPRALFESLCALSVGSSADSAWIEIAAELEAVIEAGELFAFAHGSILLNLGSSWWLHNYFLGVRDAKAKSDILYVPFIHDLIPMAMPELCVAELRNNFEEWIESVFGHADFFLVNSRNTHRDLRLAARQAGVERETAVIRLDADFRTAPTAGDKKPDRDANRALAELGLERGRFVLFVSTIEPRKNHALVFMAWLKLLRRHGEQNCPKLVCVGQRGWLNSEAHARLAASDELQRHVIIVSNASDAVLGKLYKSCICTLYPSLYEGWGLPVTESLCFGKVPVVSRVASLPEAGGGFAEYFDLDCERSFLEAVERVVFDPVHRRRREHEIESGFRPRGWQEIGAQVVDQLKSWARRRPLRPQEPEQDDPIYPASAETGVFYSLAGEHQGARGYARRGEIFRNGDGWWWAEPWGCWIREKGPTKLAFVVEDRGDTRLCVYLGLRGIQGLRGTGTVRVCDDRRIDVALGADEEKTIMFTLRPGTERQRQVVLTFTCDAVADFRLPTDGRDFRVCGLGVKWFYVCREDDIEARMNLVGRLLMEEAAWIGSRTEHQEQHHDDGSAGSLHRGRSSVLSPG